MKKKRLDKKVCVVIGGTSGLGGAIAETFAREGGIVIPVSRTKSKVTTSLKKLKKLGNSWNIAYSVNVQNENSIKQLIGKIKKKIKKIDIVICTAGCHLKKDSLKMTTKEWEKVIGTNLTGTYLVNKNFGKIMLSQKGGSIINISSLGAQVALSGATAYCVSKAGVSMLTKSLAVEWANRGVRVNAILPGVFPTPLNQKALKSKTRRKNILRRTPMARMGNTSEITGAAVYLASDESQFVTGTEVIVDGGFLASSGF